MHPGRRRRRPYSRRPHDPATADDDATLNKDYAYMRSQRRYLILHPPPSVIPAMARRFVKKPSFIKKENIYV